MKTPERILVYLRNQAEYLEQEEVTDLGFQRALELATRETTRIDVVDVLDGLSSNASSVLSNRYRTLGRELLADAVAPYQSDWNIGVDILGGDPAGAITRRAIEGRYDMVIKSAMPEPGSPSTVGPVARRLLRYAPCPVLIAKGRATVDPQLVLAAIGPTYDAKTRLLNREVLRAAFARAHHLSLPVHVLHATETDNEPQAKRDLWAFLQAAKLVVHPAAAHVLPGPFPDALVRFTATRDVDSVVVGTFGRTGIARIFQDNSAECVLSPPTPDILTVKSPLLFSRLEKRLPRSMHPVDPLEREAA